MSRFKFVAIVISLFFFCPLIVNAQESCGEEIPLYAGQTILVGNVVVSYTNGSEGEDPALKVTYNMLDDWQLTETHVAVSPISDESEFFHKMITKSGNPIPGRFPWIEEYDTPLEGVVWVIPAIDFTESIYIATHAVVTDSDGEIETAWAGDLYFEGRNWATYFEYMLDDCSNGETPPGEDPPGEDPPGEDPPGEDPPGEDPPGEDPPGEDPPGEDPPEEDPS
jgi:hypothetical protein